MGFFDLPLVEGYIKIRPKDDGSLSWHLENIEKKIKYIYIDSEFESDLIPVIHKFIDNGYKPIGGITYNNIYYAQSMILDI